MKTWLARHAAALAEASRRLTRAPLGTLLTALAVGVALALPAGAQMLLSGLLQFGRQLSPQPQISVFMEIEASPRDVAETLGRLRAHAAVVAVRHLPREETLQRFRDAEGLGEVVAALPRNPFPDAFVVTSRSHAYADLEKLQLELAGWDGIEHVQLDSAWVRRFEALLRFGRLAVALLAGLLGIALVAVSFNTIRLQILTQQAEIEVSKLLGASDAWIRRPFVYFGILQGLLAALVACLILLGASWLLAPPLRQLAESYGIGSDPGRLPVPESLALLALGAALGWLGARLSLARHLREIEPR